MRTHAVCALGARPRWRANTSNSTHSILTSLGALMHPALLATSNAFARNALAILAAASMLGLLSSEAAFAGKPLYAEVVISDSEGGDEVESCAPETAKIHITAALGDGSPGMKISSNWIAEKTKVAPPNYGIDSIALTVA